MSSTSRVLPMKSSAISTRFESEDGPTAVEYAVLLALILLAVMSAITAVGNTTSALWRNDANRITGARDRRLRSRRGKGRGTAPVNHGATVSPWLAARW
jgi:pilus assembly protein Flp/PilA